MMYKIVTRNGKVVAFGPNDGNYDPFLLDGDIVTFSDTIPVDTTAPILTAIAAIEALQTDRMIRGAAINSTVTFPSTDPNFPNMTDAQALASIETRVQALRAQLKTTN